MNASKTVIRRLPCRRGYALVVVLLFNVLFLMLLGVAWRQMVGAIRVASVRTEQMQRDEGVVPALARAVALLETGPPPEDPYVRGATIETSAGPRLFRVTFTLEAGTTWSVCSTPALPNESLVAMPSTFAAPPP